MDFGATQWKDSFITDARRNPESVEGDMSVFDSPARESRDAFSSVSYECLSEASGQTGRRGDGHHGQGQAKRAVSETQAFPSRSPDPSCAVNTVRWARAA